MNRRLPLLTLSATGLIALSIGCAAPAFAATPSPAASATDLPTPATAASTKPQAPTGAKALLTPTISEITISSEDDLSAEWASVILTGGTPGAGYQVFNDTNGDETRPYSEISATGYLVGRLVIETGEHNAFRFVTHDPDDFDKVQEFRVDVDDTRPDFVAPRVSTAVEDGRIVITGNGSGTPETGGRQRSTQLWVRDAQGHLVAQSTMTSGQASVALPESSSETRYSVTMYNRHLESPAAHVVVNEGVGTSEPDAPEVSVTGSGTKMIAEAEGEKGATLTIRDSGGKVVATRMIGANERAAVVLPASAEGQTLVATQSRGQVVSEGIDVVVPTR